MNVLIILLYELFLLLIAVLALPITVYSLIFKKKYRKSILQRFGIGLKINKSSEFPCIWIHAVSLGETKAVVSIARELKQLFPSNPLIISSVTETGHAETKRSISFADRHVYLPFDFRWIIARIFKKIHPGLVIICESDFWFNFLDCAKKKGAMLALVNGKISERSANRFNYIPFFTKRLFGLFDQMCVQNVLYKERFLKAGAQNEKITVTGNLKLDDDFPRLSDDEVVQWRQKLGIKPGQIVLTIGSSHAPEEQYFLDAFKDLFIKFPQLFIILVPRHPERFKDVGRLLEKERINWINFSDINRRTGTEKVILVDAMGLLRMCYQLSDFAIVAGSFTERVGGHNILEPSWYGKAVLFGPYMHSQLEFVNLMIQYNAGVQIDKDQLRLKIEEWLEHHSEMKKIGNNGLKMIEDLRGSKKRTLEALEPLLERLREKNRVNEK